MGKIGLIIGREYTSRVKKKSFILMTLLGPLLMGGFLSAAIYFGMQDDTMNKVLVADPGGLFKDGFKDSEKIKFKVEARDIPFEELKQKRYEDYNLLLQIPEQPLQIKNALLFYRDQPSSRVENYITNQLNGAIELLKVENAKIDKKIYNYIKSTYVQVSLVDIDKTSEKKSPYLSTLGFFFAIFIYMFIFLYGAQVMRGVIEEKTSRVVEVIVSSVTPFQLMMGKIIGIALVGLTQFIAWIGLMFGIFFIMQSYIFGDIYDPAMQAASNIPGTVDMAANSDLFNLLFQINYPVVISVFIFYFLGGYLLYASLFAAVGSAVDSEADTQQFMLPISVPLVFAYIISAMGIENPEGSAQVWCSFIPFTSPVCMMVRVVTGDVQIWQVIVSMLILVITFIFTTWFAGKIYRTGILMYGKKASYKELWKWMRYKG